jgi:hypothetical protein
MSTSPREFFKICDGCGEIFDANNEDEARHHVQGEHPPLLPARTLSQRPLICELAA